MPVGTHRATNRNTVSSPLEDNQTLNGTQLDAKHNPESVLRPDGKHAAIHLLTYLSEFQRIKLNDKIHRYFRPQDFKFRKTEIQKVFCNIFSKQHRQPD